MTIINCQNGCEDLNKVYQEDTSDFVVNSSWYQCMCLFVKSQYHSGYLSKEHKNTNSKKDVYTHMFIAVLFTTAKR